MIINWYSTITVINNYYCLVGALEHQFYFPIYWVANHPNWLSYFSEGWPNHQPAWDWTYHEKYTIFYQLIISSSPIIYINAMKYLQLMAVHLQIINGSVNFWSARAELWDGSADACRRHGSLGVTRWTLQVPLKTLFYSIVLVCVWYIYPFFEDIWRV